ncbi:MAG: hypothetical protein GXP16_10275 [Gammaproteobacteria bacterium]|nr:hypothetical protein [Gammaproteobacteria bacterium]
MEKDRPLSFGYRLHKDGSVQILRHQRLAITLRGVAADKFVVKIEKLDAQQRQLLMARATGQFKFGNERLGKEKGRR